MIDYNILSNTKENSNSLLNLSQDEIDKILFNLAVNIEKNTSLIIAENKKDLIYFEREFGIDNPNYDRLLLDERRIKSIISSVEQISKQKLKENRDIKEINGLKIEQISVPFGVVLVIYESRPNVTVDVFSLCFKSQNACLLKGGKEALNSNRIFVKIIKDTLNENGISKDIINLLEIERDDLDELLKHEKYIDLCIPRGGKKLIEFVKEKCRIPFIETGAGVVHIYIDKEYDLEIAKNLILNSKTRRFSTCNALDCVLFHKNNLNDLNILLKPLEEKNTIIYCKEELYQRIRHLYKFLEIDKIGLEGNEFLSNKMLLIEVDDVENAVSYINKYSSKHTECIISNNKKNVDLFNKNIDAAVVYTNTATVFTDGEMFGLGGEIGISTQKMHARGPMGADILKIAKYIVSSRGKTRD